MSKLYVNCTVFSIVVSKFSRSIIQVKILIYDKFYVFLYFKNIELKNKKSCIQRKKDRRLHWEKNVFSICNYNYMIKYLLLETPFL